MTSILIIANIISLIASIIMVASGLVKDQKKFMIVQIVYVTFFSIANYLLGGYSSVIVNVINIIRNLLSLKFAFNNYFKAAFIGVNVLLCILLNREGLLGWLPVIGVCLITATIGIKNQVIFKIAVALGQVCWAIYDFNIKNYVALCFDIFTIVTNLISIYQLLKDKDNEKGAN